MSELSHHENNLMAVSEKSIEATLTGEEEDISLLALFDQENKKVGNKSS